MCHEDCQHGRIFSLSGVEPVRFCCSCKTWFHTECSQALVLNDDRELLEDAGQGYIVECYDAWKGLELSALTLLSSLPVERTPRELGAPLSLEKLIIQARKKWNDEQGSTVAQMDKICESLLATSDAHGKLSVIIKTVQQAVEKQLLEGATYYSCPNCLVYAI